MPTTKQYGTPSEANTTIGGVPTLHYFDLGSRGRGQAVRLFFEDAGIAYEDISFTPAEWPEYKKDKIYKQNPVGTVPVVELNGQILTQSYAMLRHFARVLGAYDGRNEAEKYWADTICDIVIDWRTLFVEAFFHGSEESYSKYKSTHQVRFLKGVDTQLSNNSLSQSGPFVIGTEFTYADVVLYQVCHDEGLTKDGRKGLQEYPRIKKLIDAVEERPRIKDYLNSDRYHG